MHSRADIHAFLHLTDDGSLIELLASPRRAQTRTAAEAGGQHRQHRCSRPTHSKAPLRDVRTARPPERDGEDAG